VTEQELNKILEMAFPNVPQIPIVEAAKDGALQVRLPFHPQFVRPGGTLSGPTLMTLADTVAYVLLMERDSNAAKSVTSQLNISFLRRPEPVDLIGNGRILKFGKRLAVVGVSMFTNGELVSEAMVTYAMPSN